ncbi:MAG: pyridoxal 5'-phosphate synthase glutaminase subunit PdxT [Spirochaetales bacterium]|nr:pyridoxal 5'-phosphate synthase glutaminase subunit PdxT [Spirochaetales bacterium]
MSETTGVLALQGGFDAHIRMLETLGCRGIAVKTAARLDHCSRLILPGGESTVMNRLLSAGDLRTELIRRIQGGMPVFGTCAGLILLSSGVAWSCQETLGLLDCTVRRNAYGRQTESFETDLNWDYRSIPGIFIRAPRIEETGPECRCLIRYEDSPVLVRQNNILAASFHPELTESPEVHSYFLKMK